MNLLFLGVLLIIPGIFLFSTQGFGSSLITTSEINKIGTLKITDSTGKALIGFNLGTNDDISSITMTFKNSIANNDSVDISLKDKNGLELGSGSKIISPSSTIVTINLSDTITQVERPALRSASITVS